MSKKGEEFEYDSGSDVSEIDPESEVLAPVQRRIEEQLRKHLQELTQQLRDTTNEYGKTQKDREQCGVDLYNAQQHLAKLQETLEKHHEKQATVQLEHEERLVERNDLAAVADAAQQRTNTMQKQYNTFQDELGKLTETLLKVEQFNEQLKSEVELEKRAAHKTEDDITRLERAKIRQDNLVATLQLRIRTLEEQSATLKEQIDAQKSETLGARDTLAEAMSEMEVINVEKRQLMHQWRSSLIGMQRRHDALKKTEEALDKQRDDLQVIENEISGFRRDVRDARTENAKLTAFMSRIDNEIIILEKQMDVLLERRDRNAESYAIMKSAVERTELETKALEAQIKAKAIELQELEKQIAKHAKAIVDMENAVLEHLSKQTTLKRESQGALRDIENLKTAIRTKETQVLVMENELARIRVDTLQARSYNDTLQATLSELEKELQSRGVMIDRVQQDIRRRNDEIDRKQKQLDQLNNQYEQIMSAHGGEKGEHVGPLEATISSLSKAITAKSNENEALQQEWIKLQTELVGCKSAMGEIDDAILDSQTKATILTQKRDRLMSAIGLKRQEIAALENKSNAMHLEMKRVNTLLSKNANTTDVVANDAFLLENDLVRRLEDKKREAIQLERKVEETKGAKADTLQQILDCERDIMFWERKLQIARETEMALDPTIGKAEIEKMKKEIGFMEQRMTQLQREQKFLIEEMQKLIDHRETIRTKGMAIQNATHLNKRGTTRLQVDKENARLFKDLNARRQEAQAKERQVKESLAEVERTATDLDRAQREIEDMDTQLENLQAELAVIHKQRERADDEKRIKQNSLQRMRDGEKGSYKLACYPQDAPGEVARLEDGRRAVVGIMEQLASEFPDLADELQELMEKV